MHFIIRAKDGTDAGAPARRQAARDAHLALIAELKAQGHALFGAALLDDEGKMVGSTLLMDFPSHKELNAWLLKEPYVTSKVWQDLEISACQIAPSFAGLFKK